MRTGAARFLPSVLADLNRPGRYAWLLRSPHVRVRRVETAPFAGVSGADKAAAAGSKKSALWYLVWYPATTHCEDCH